MDVPGLDCHMGPNATLMPKDYIVWLKHQGELPLVIGNYIVLYLPKSDHLK